MRMPKRVTAQRYALPRQLQRAFQRRGNRRNRRRRKTLLQELGTQREAERQYASLFP